MSESDIINTTAPARSSSWGRFLFIAILISTVIKQKPRKHLLRYYSSKELHVLSAMSMSLKTSFYATATPLSTSTVVALIPQSAKTPAFIKA